MITIEFKDSVYENKPEVETNIEIIRKTVDSKLIEDMDPEVYDQIIDMYNQTNKSQNCVNIFNEIEKSKKTYNKEYVSEIMDQIVTMDQQFYIDVISFIQALATSYNITYFAEYFNSLKNISREINGKSCTCIDKCKCNEEDINNNSDSEVEAEIAE